jgi:hypothetical protein
LTHVALRREHDLSNPCALLDNFMGTPGFVERENLVDQHLQFVFGGKLERQFEIVGRMSPTDAVENRSGVVC